MKKHLVRIALGVLVVLVFLGHAADIYRIPLVTNLEAIIYDARLRLTMPRGVDTRIVIVDIDEKSLDEKNGEGHWPWRRDHLGDFLDQLFDHYQVKVVGFDVVFAEKDQSSAVVLSELAQSEFKTDPRFQDALTAIAPKLEFDRLFAEKMRGRRVVLSYYFTPEAGAPASGLLPEPVLPKGVFQGRNVTAVTYKGFGANLGELQHAAASAGHFNPIADPDGVFRRVPILAEYRGAYYEPLALAVVRVLLGSPPVRPVFTDAPLWSKRYPGLEWVEVGQLRIPVDIGVTALVPYRGPERSFPYVSASDVLRGKADEAVLKNSIVLVGATAPGLLDLRSTPVAPVYPGVEIHANLIAGILDGTIKQRPPYVLGAEVLLLFLSGVVMALVLPLLSPLKGMLVTLLVLGAVFGTNVLVWNYANLVLPLASGGLMIALLFALNMSYGFLVESHHKRQITRLFEQYVPPELVDEMSENPENFSMAGKHREMSVLFTDVRGFTTISEQLPAEDLTQLMNEFLTPLTRVIYRHRGTIDKYMGDCIMAFWGAPLDDEKHAHHAVLAGMEMQSTMDSLQPHFRSRDWPELHIGVGINTGRMSVGNMGSEIRVAYTVMGDAVNLASRLEGLTKHYGVDVIVGEGTRSAVEMECTRSALEKVVFRELDRVTPKGKKEPVAIFEPIGPEGAVDRARKDELSLWHEALKQYRAQKWDMAELQLINLQQRFPDTELYSLFLKRIAHFRSNPPGAGWNGAWAFETK